MTIHVNHEHPLTGRSPTGDYVFGMNKVSGRMHLRGQEGDGAGCEHHYFRAMRQDIVGRDGPSEPNLDFQLANLDSEESDDLAQFFPLQLTGRHPELPSTLFRRFTI